MPRLPHTFAQISPTGCYPGTPVLPNLFYSCPAIPSCGTDDALLTWNQVFLAVDHLS
jgi:hypothetical protein